MVDGMANPVMMGGSSEDRDNTDGGVSSVESQSNQNTISKSDLNNGAASNMFLPLAGAKRGDTVSSLPALQRDLSGPVSQFTRNSIAMTDMAENLSAVGSTSSGVTSPKVRAVEVEQGGGASQGSSPSDRTSLLHTEHQHPVS